jgi:hypothetical protein
MASVGPTPCSGLKSDIASPIPKAHFETVLNMSPDAFATEAMGMRHCLPGKLAVSLREADSSRLRHIAAGTHDLGNHPLNVRFNLLCGLKSDISRGPRSANSGHQCATLSLSRGVGLIWLRERELTPAAQGFAVIFEEMWRHSDKLIRK